MDRRRPTALLVAVLVALAAGVAACGGEDGAGTDDFVDAANEICREGDERIDALPDPQSIEDAGRQAGEVEEIGREAIEDLEELELPADEQARDRAEDYIDQLREAIDGLDAVREAAEAGDQTAFQSAAEAVREETARASEIAEELGAEECVEDPEQEATGGGEQGGEAEAGGATADAEGDCVQSWNSDADRSLKQVLALSHAEGNTAQVGPYIGEEFTAEAFDTTTTGTGTNVTVSEGDCVVTEVSDGTVLSVFVRSSSDSSWHRLSESDTTSPLSDGPEGLVEPVTHADVAEGGDLAPAG